MRFTSFAAISVFLSLSHAASASVELGKLTETGAQRWYPQTLQGMPIVGHGIAQLRSRTGHDYTHSNLLSSPAPIRVVLSATDAMHAVPAMHGRQTMNAALQLPKLVLVNVPMIGVRPLWRVLGDVRFTPQLSQRRYDVDAETGEVLGATELIDHLVGARVYPTNPVASPLLQLSNLAVQPNPTNLLSSSELVAHNCADNNTLRNVFGQDFRVCELTQSATPDADGNFTVAPDDAAGSTTRNDDAFSQLSMYAHSARAYAFFRGLRGDPSAQVVAATQLNVVSNVRFDPQVASLLNGGSGGGATSTAATRLRSYDNAFFFPGDNGGFVSQILGLPGNGGLVFGQGRNVDYAYDGDVVYHELTHAVVNHSLQLGRDYVQPWGYSTQPGAMNEGLADYFSSAITGDPALGEYAGGWDSGSIRNLANNFTCNQNIAGEVHYDSQLFSGGLWSVRTALPAGDRAVFDAAIYTAMRLHPGSETLAFHEFIGFVIDVLRTELPSVEPLMVAEMTRRGVLPACEPTVETIDNVETIAPEAFGSIAAYLAPGQSDSGLALTPGVVQFKASVDGTKTGSTLDVSLGWYNQDQSVKNPLQVIVHFDTPLVWARRSGRYAHNGTAYNTTGSNQSTVNIPVPDGATVAYFQVVNSARASVYYASVSATFRAQPRPPVDAGAPDAGSLSADAGARDSGASDAGSRRPRSSVEASVPADADAIAVEDDGANINGGGGCSTQRTSGHNLSLQALIGLALIWGRKRTALYTRTTRGTISGLKPSTR